MNLKHLACLLFLLWLAACKKPDYEYHWLHPSAKQLFSYKPGTYWILKDSATGLTDSLYVVLATIHTHDSGMHRFEDYILGLSCVRQSPSGPDTISWNLRTAQSVSGRLTATLDIRKHSGSHLTVVSYPYFYTEPLQASSRDEVTGRNVTFSREPVVVVNGQSFDSVFVVRYTDPLSGEEDHFYYNADAGFIKADYTLFSGRRTVVLERRHLVR